MSGRIQRYKEELNRFLNQDNAFARGLAKIEEKTKVNRVHIFLGKCVCKALHLRPQILKVSRLIKRSSSFFVGGVGLFALYLIFGYGAALIVNALGAIYPAYAS